MSGIANRSGPVLSIAPPPPQQQQMSSVPPPPMGPGGHPRYPQHNERPYGGPPPPNYGNYPNQSYPPYGGNYGAQAYPRAPPGYPPSYGPGYGAAPNGAFPPQHHPPYYQGGYDYGAQQQPPAPPPSYRGPSPVPPPSRSLPQAPPSADENTKKASNPQVKKEEASEPKQPTPDHSEVERLRAAAAQELTTEEVKPIQTDFHFFVKENMEKYRKLAEEEVTASLGDSWKEGDELDPLLVNSNLNTRLMKAWEDLTKEDRDAYMVKEEADRRRFMEDDEIASRHCATLTARGKSPRVLDSKKIKEEPKDEPKEEIKEEPKRPVETEASAHESPTKKSKAAE